MLSIGPHRSPEAYAGEVDMPRRVGLALIEAEKIAKEIDVLARRLERVLGEFPDPTETIPEAIGQMDDVTQGIRAAVKTAEGFDYRQDW